MRSATLKAAIAALPLVLGITLSTPAQAGIIGDRSTIVPLISAGAPPDSPGNRVDANLPTSPYSGVVSINIRYANGDSFICSGTLVSKRDVITAGHCVDSDGAGHLININAAGNDVRVVFNAQPNPGDPGRAIITADAVSMNPNYQGFGNCPIGVPGFCVNDDIAVIHMNADAPSMAKIYGVYGGTVGEGQLDTLVGYGRSGNDLGYTTGPDFRIKRSGQNYMDLFDTNDEANFAPNSPQEVWYSDFDGTDRNGVFHDTFCTLFGVCTPILANNVETNIGGGDSGGPSFLNFGGQLLLMGNNTFGGTFQGQTAGAMGTYFGGILMQPYLDYLVATTDGRIAVVGGVPEPGSLALMGLALFGVFATRRRALS